MKSDPIVDEVRKVREAHAAKFNYDLSAICADLKQKERKAGHPVISRQLKVPLESMEANPALQRSGHKAAAAELTQ